VRVTIEVVAFTHTGRVREHNEDTVAVGEWVRNEPMEAPERFSLDAERPVVVLVADGMGGHNAGEVASRLAAERLGHVLARADLDAAEIEAALLSVNREIFDRMRERPEWLGMGTTVVGLVFAGDRAWAFNVGDSRGYRVQDGFLAQITTDDTRDAVAYGEAGPGRKTGAITQALGGAPSFVEILPHVQGVRVRPGSVFLLCSDGLSDMVGLDDMEAALSDDLGQSARALFDKAMAAGGEDNVSIVLAASR
jgi:serine/threonine protein phosphatase PrpC